MLRTSKMWQFVVYLSCLVLVQADFDYPRIKLENYCGQTYYLSCPDQWSSSTRAGKLFFYVVPIENCSVTVQTAGVCNVNHAVYINIPRSDLGPGDWVEIYENVQPGNPGNLIKRIPGGASPRNRYPDSVAQLLTSYNTQQRLKFNLFLEPKPATVYSHEVHFDYTLVKSSPSYGESYCRSLSGYIPNSIICTGYSYATRLNCPMTYTPAVDISNRAYQQQTCDSTTTTRRNYFYGSTTYSTATTRTTTQSYEESERKSHVERSFAEMKALTIAGMFLLVLVALLLLVLLVAMITRMSGKRFPLIGNFRKGAGFSKDEDHNPLFESD